MARHQTISYGPVPCHLFQLMGPWGIAVVSGTAVASSIPWLAFDDEARRWHGEVGRITGRSGDPRAARGANARELAALLHDDPERVMAGRRQPGKVVHQQRQADLERVHPGPSGHLQPQRLHDLGDDQHCPDLLQHHLALGRPQEVQSQVARDRRDRELDVPGRA
jgi:hypothetical protein